MSAETRNATAIQAEQVGKRYYLGEGVGGPGGLAAALESGLKAPFRRLRGHRPVSHVEGEEFWALRDVSFSIERGEVVGMIGRNGAGKSTMLKILAQITPPTEGRVVLRGRVSSLLEVGTGFHPELTGRENIFLNGTVLGMRRRQIVEKFDEIVEFSEIGQFLDTPVKRYSSGMYVRLAFSVASHLLTEILLIDEVLAVGDAAFQRKCLDRMEAISRSGDHTIIFVSHSTQTVRKVADRIILLEDGRLTLDGPAEEVTAKYLERIQPIEHGGFSVIGRDVTRGGTGEARTVRVALQDDSGNIRERIHFGEPFTVELTVEVDKPIPEAAFDVGISTQDGGRFMTASSSDKGGEWLELRPGTHKIRARIEATLYPGEFVIDAGIYTSNGTQIDDIERVLSFTGLNTPAVEGGERYQWDVSQGYVRAPSSWTPVEEPSPVEPLTAPVSPGQGAR